MRIAFLTACTLFCAVLQAQTASPKEDPLPVFKQVGHPFLPAITSEFFFFSEDGLMWFSTARGLTSFDGSEVMYYSSLSQANDLGLHTISFMAEDKQHNFYIASIAGLIYYNRTTNTFSSVDYIFSDTKQSKRLLFASIYCDEKGIVYAGSISDGFFIYDPESKKTIHYNLEAGKPDSWRDRSLNTVSSIAVAPDGLWLGSFNGIYHFNKTTGTLSRHFDVINPGFYKYSAGSPYRLNVQKMDVAGDSVIWFNSWTGGFGKYYIKTGKVKLFLHNARLNTPTRYIGFVLPKFARLSDHSFLLGIYDDKTAIFDTRTETARYFTVTPNGYTEEQTRFVTNDRQGNVWLLQRGLLYVAVPPYLGLKSLFIPNQTATGFVKPILRGMYYDTARHIYYGAFLNSTGIHVFDSSLQPAGIVPTPVINNYFTYNSSVNSKTGKDGSGRLWSIGWNNYILPPGTSAFIPVEKYNKALQWLSAGNDFIDVKSIPGGDILIKREGERLYHINHQTLQTDSLSLSPGTNDGIEIKSSEWYDRKNNMAYILAGGDLFQFNINNNQKRDIPARTLFGKLPALQGASILSLDAKGRIWFLVWRYGIRIIDPQTLTCTDSIPFGDRGLMRGDYTTVICGGEQYMLFGSRNGIVVYDYKNARSFLFDHANGLSSPDNKGLLYCNGYLVVSETNAIEYFKLSELKNYLLTVHPHLNTITTDTSTVYIYSGKDPTGALVLPYYNNNISISFSAPEFFFPERIEYAWQLDEVDKDWHYTNYFSRRISYNNLRPGKYIFRLKAQRWGGNWMHAPVEYVIIIQPAWWQSTWFNIAVAVVIAALLFYFIRYRINAVRRKEQQRTLHEKELLELEAKALRAQMNPHFIFNSLNSIKSLINKSENDKAASYLTTFSKLIRTLFQHSDKREVSLYEELETCKLYTQLEGMRFGSKVSFMFDIDERIDLKDIKVPALILQPFIENAIWHGLMPKETGGYVKIIVRQGERSVSCTIDDDGIGRELSRMYKGEYDATYESRGISLTQSRLNLDRILNDREDSIRIIDKKDSTRNACGTTVIITFNNNKE